MEKISHWRCTTSLEIQTEFKAKKKKKKHSCLATAGCGLPQPQFFLALKLEVQPCLDPNPGGTQPITCTSHKRKQTVATFVFVDVLLSAHHVPYRFHMSVVFKGLNQTFHPCSGYAVLYQPFTGNERVERGWSNLSTTVQWLLKCQISPSAHTNVFCVFNTRMTDLRNLPNLFQWRTVLDDVGEGAGSSTPYAVACQAAIA